MTNKEEILQIVEQHYSNQQFDVTHLAGQLDVSDTHLCEMFKIYFGLKPRRFIEVFRIATSVPLFGNSLDWYHVCLKVGYSSIKTFARAFESVTKMKPAQWNLILRSCIDREQEIQSLQKYIETTYKIKVL